MLEESLWELLLTIFLKFRICFLFKIKHSTGHISGNGWSDSCEAKMKCIGRILVQLYSLDCRRHQWFWPGILKVDHGRARCVAMWAGWMYRILADMISDVGVPPTNLLYLVCQLTIFFSYSNWWFILNFLSTTLSRQALRLWKSMWSTSIDLNCRKKTC